MVADREIILSMEECITSKALWTSSIIMSLEKNDELGRAMKQSMAANMIQASFDKDMTKEMASFNNALGQSQHAGSCQP